MAEKKLQLGKGWAVLAVDIQNDFVSGSLAVSHGEEVIDPTNKITALAQESGVPVVMSADWHPRRTSHFAEFGGKWPVHCVQETEGARFDSRLQTQGVEVFYKGTSINDDGYSPFEGVNLQGQNLEHYLKQHNIHNLVVTGLATDYCVKAGVLDALKQKNWRGKKRYNVFVVEDAIRAVDLIDGDGQKSLDEMKAAGAQIISSRRIAG